MSEKDPYAVNYGPGADDYGRDTMEKLEEKLKEISENFKKPKLPMTIKEALARACRHAHWPNDLPEEYDTLAEYGKNHWLKEADKILFSLRENKVMVIFQNGFDKQQLYYHNKLRGAIQKVSRSTSQNTALKIAYRNFKSHLKAAIKRVEQESEESGKLRHELSLQKECIAENDRLQRELIRKEEIINLLKGYFELFKSIPNTIPSYALSDSILLESRIQYVVSKSTQAIKEIEKHFLAIPMKKES